MCCIAISFKWAAYSDSSKLCWAYALQHILTPALPHGDDQVQQRHHQAVFRWAEHVLVGCQGPWDCGEILGRQEHYPEAFADLAETKTGIVDIVGRAAGLDPNDHVQCQPLKTAWRNTEAQTKAELEANANGEDLQSME